MTHDSLTTSRWFIGTGIAVTAASALLLVTACSQIRQQTGDAWSVTYEVTVDSAAGAPLTDVRVEGAERRGDAPEVSKLGSETTSTPHADAVGSVWEHKSIVLATDRAMVTATPEAGATASCRILLDGKEVIAEEHADAGAPVTCRVTTPAFS
jgi:hypothetical protein